MECILYITGIKISKFCSNAAWRFEIFYPLFTKSVVKSWGWTSACSLLFLPLAQLPAFSNWFCFYSSGLNTLDTFTDITKWLKTLIQSTGPTIVRVRKMGTGLHQPPNTNRPANGEKKSLKSILRVQSPTFLWTHRLQQELLTLMMSGDKGISAFPNGDDVFSWIGTIIGPQGTVSWKLTFNIFDCSSLHSHVTRFMKE